MNDTGLVQKDLKSQKSSYSRLYECQSPLKLYAKFPRCVHVCTILERRLSAFISCSNGF